MRRAMASAEVGDDWYGDDPTVNRLEERAAEVTGKEAAVYLATGTMANQIALHVFARPGHLVIAEADSHVANTEVTSTAMLSGLGFIRLAAHGGQLSAPQVERALRPDPYGVEVIDLVAIENTHQVGGGTVASLHQVQAIRLAARAARVPLYMDGARIFNASAASGVRVDEYAAEVDALMFSLSKGLGAPIGSLLCGPSEFIREARRAKILMGGAWRQAGVVAAAGLVALAEGPARLPEDHDLAKTLAEALHEATPGAVKPEQVQTNIIFLDTEAMGLDPLEAVRRLREHGILATVVAGKVRMVTHLDVSRQDIGAAAEAWRNVASETVITTTEG